MNGREKTKDRIIIEVFVHPRSRTSEIKLIEGDLFDISVKEPPDKGKANKAIIKLLASSFKIPTSSVTIVQGHKNTRKRIILESITPEAYSLMKKELC
ncbi:MAG: DUF167 domain-containing protein [Promethearchaeota archaeon]